MSLIKGSSSMKFVLVQGPLKKWTEYSLKLYLCRGGVQLHPGAGWYGPYRCILQIITSSSTYLMRGQTFFYFTRTWFLSCSNRLLLMNFIFWLLGVELIKSIALSSLNFYKGMKIVILKSKYTPKFRVCSSSHLDFRF